MSGGAKLLIPHGSAAVAEGRQARLHRHIQTTEAPATRLSWLRVVASAQRVLADDNKGVALNQALLRSGRQVCDPCRKKAFDFAYCRPFSTLHRFSDLSYTEVRIVIALTVYTGLRRQTYGFLAARQEDSRY